jgi:glycosyltransferase involved in cell wall biosynthesis
MKILVVGKDHHGEMSPFVADQITALQKLGVTVDSYAISGKGLSAYLWNVGGINKKINVFHPDVIHAHYGLSGLTANYERRVPVVTTYHGSDIHSGGWILKLSQLAMRMSAFNIFVGEKLMKASGFTHSNCCVLPCGVDLDVIKEEPKETARAQLHFSKSMVLFSGAFSDSVKNAALAKAAMRNIPEAELVELKGYTRQEVCLLMNAADCLLMTSDREGSPQVIKEAMACGTPIVSVDVGDVREVIADTDGCYIAERDAEDIAQKIRCAIAFAVKTNGRKRIINLNLGNEQIAKRLVDIYKEVLRH